MMRFSWERECKKCRELLRSHEGEVCEMCNMGIKAEPWGSWQAPIIPDSGSMWEETWPVGVKGQMSASKRKCELEMLGYLVEVERTDEMWVLTALK